MEGEKRIPTSQLLKEIAIELWDLMKFEWQSFIGSIKFNLYGPDDIVKGLSPLSHVGVISEDDPFWKKRIEAARKKKEEEEKRKKEEKEKKRKRRAEAVKRFRKVVTWFCRAAKKENEDAKRH